ncbi:MAG: hypothetical protein ACYCZR_02215 [Burkholderiales bacterium]
MLTISSVRTRGLCRALGWDYPTGAAFFFRALRFVPYVQPFLDRLKFAAQVQFHLIHLARLSFLSMAGSVVFLSKWVSQVASSGLKPRTNCCAGCW